MPDVRISVIIGLAVAAVAGVSWEFCLDSRSTGLGKISV